MVVPPSIKPVSWVGNTKKDLSDLHKDVRDTVGQALFEAQRGGKHSTAKSLGGYGDAGVLEIVVDHAGATFRAVYTVRWPDYVYVVHVFQKKSKSGIKTPKVDLDLIEDRMKRIKKFRDDAAKAKRKKGSKDE
jgi:phage-related protein